MLEVVTFKYQTGIPGVFGTRTQSLSEPTTTLLMHWACSRWHNAAIIVDPNLTSASLPGRRRISALLGYGRSYIIYSTWAIALVTYRSRYEATKTFQYLTSSDTLAKPPSRNIDISPCRGRRIPAEASSSFYLPQIQQRSKLGAVYLTFVSSARCRANCLTT